MDVNLKRNSKDSPANENETRQLHEQEIDERNIAVVQNQMESTQMKKSLRDKLFKTNKKETQPGENKKSVGRKLKTFEIYKFADKYDILFMILGTITALATGAAIPIMMSLAKSVLNGLVYIDAGNYTVSTNCYSDPSATGDPYTAIQGIIKWYAVIGASSLVLHWMCYAFWMSASERQSRRIRYALFKSIMKQEIGWFDCRNAGELSSRLVDDLKNIREGIGFHVADFICLLSQTIASLIFALYTGWKLTLAFLSISPLIIFSFVLIVKVLVKYAALELKAYSTANAIAQEVLGAIRTVTAFSGQNKETERYEKNLIQAKNVGIQKNIMVGLAIGLINIILYGGTVIIFWYGPYLIRNECQNYSAGHWIVIFNCCLTPSLSLYTLMPHIQSFAEASCSGEYVFEIIERQSKINIFNNDGQIPTKLTGDIEFKNVHFTYPARQEASILNGFNIKIPSGKTIALCGVSGSGKSTLIQLIQRFYDPDQGQILLDGQDLRSINLRWLRSNIGIVSQEPVLFFGTIEDNIRFGKPNATDEEVIAAAKMANAHDFIMQLPQNYKTSSGNKLSGGQKQRVAIARALISNPKILLLDEATAALDNQSEKIVQDALDRAKEGRTTIIIAHRLSTIKNADVIIGLDHGEVIEYGTHNQLIERKGLYYELVTAQSENEKQHRTDVNNKENGLEEELTMRISESIKHGTYHPFRRMSIAFSRQSIASIKSVISEAVGEIRYGVEINDQVEKESRCHMPFLFKILQLNSPEWFYLLLGGIASIAFGAMMPALFTIFANIFGVLAETDLKKQEDDVRTYTYIMFLAGVAGGIVLFISTAALGKAAEELTMRMRIISFKSILRQEIGWFDMDENNLGALVTRLSSDAASLRGFTGPTFVGLLNGLGGFISILIICFIAGWRLTLVLLCFTPLIIFTGVIQGQQLSNMANKKKTSISNAENGGKHATEAIENIRPVVSLCQEEHFIRLYEDAFNRDFRNRMLFIHYIALANALANSLLYFINAAAFGYGITLIKSNEMKFQDVFRVFTVVTFGTMAIGRSISQMPNYSNGKVSAKRIFELNKRQSRIDPNDPSGIVLSDVTGNIEFRDVGFRYPARIKCSILRHLNLTCSSGETTALVGSSGGGKSTTIALLERFYDPIAGTVFIDGHDIKTLNIRWLRSILGLVQQEPILFNLSIRDNIAYGDSTGQVTQDRIEVAARKANIHDIITSLPEGYDTTCGTKGSQLSGGQKQRIAIARALIRNPKILLLDEATSALDNRSEKVVQDALDEARAGRTCLTIAHRLSTIRNSNKICVLDCGQIKESGRHEQLLQQNGIYHKLNMAQERQENLKDKQNC